MEGVGGPIVEAEAYAHDDPASHSFRGRRVSNAAMFGPPGTLYVYRSYGIHWCVNVVCRPAGVGAAVLVRSLEPVHGVETMRARRGREPLATGPGNVGQALGATPAQNGEPAVLLPPDRPRRVEASARIGITKGTERPWRFFDPDSGSVSRRGSLELRRQPRADADGRGRLGRGRRLGPPGVETPKQRPLLVLVRLHAREDVVERRRWRSTIVRALVQHHAFGALAHRRVGDLRARGLAGLRERLEHLGGPDDGHVGGLAQPQDLLLHLGEALVAASRPRDRRGRSSRRAGRLRHAPRAAAPGRCSNAAPVSILSTMPTAARRRRAVRPRAAGRRRDGRGRTRGRPSRHARRRSRGRARSVAVEGRQSQGRCPGG